MNNLGKQYFADCESIAESIAWTEPVLRLFEIDEHIFAARRTVVASCSQHACRKKRQHDANREHSGEIESHLHVSHPCSRSRLPGGTAMPVIAEFIGLRSGSASRTY